VDDDLPRTSYLGRRPESSRWYYKRRFPTHLVDVIGRERFEESTGKADWNEAKAEIGRMEARYRMAIAAAEERLAEGAGAVLKPGPIVSRFPTLLFPTTASLPRLTDDQAIAFARSFFQERLRELDRDDLNRSTDGRWAVELDDRIAMLRDPDDEGTLRWTQEEAAHILRHHGIGAEPHRDAGLLLTNLVRRALLELLAMQKARLEGDYSGSITDSMFRAPVVAAIAPAPSARFPRTTLNELIATYEQNTAGDNEHLTPKTKAKHQAAYTVIRRFFGADCVISDINRAACRSFRDTLASLPPNFTKLAPADTPLAELIILDSKANTLQRATQATYLLALTRLLTHAATERMIEHNPLSEPLSAKGKKIKRERARNAYSDDQLQKIFNAPIYTGCVDDERGYAKPRPGHVIKRSRYWVPLIALFTGLRMNEILQITRWHVRPAPDGLPGLLIGDDMRLKTPASYRVVPVPDILLQCGFMRFVESKNGSLFDDVPPGSDDYQSSVFSKRYSTFQKSLELDEAGRNVSFHSFRHNFRDALRLPDVDAALAKEIGGWSRGGDTFDSYGDGARAVVLRPLINRVSYPIDISHLYAV
jgi:integrase